MNGLGRRRIEKSFPGLVHLTIHDGPDDRDDYDDDEIPCCIGGAMHGPRACNCWEPIYDLEQTEQLNETAEVVTRTTCCSDCAYRTDSPERAAGDLDMLADVAGTPGHVFACHVGLRRAIAYRHPDGREIPAGPGDYQPPMLGAQAFKADGTPAELCAGWASYRRGLLG